MSGSGSVLYAVRIALSTLLVVHLVVPQVQAVSLPKVMSVSPSIGPAETIEARAERVIVAKQVNFMILNEVEWMQQAGESCWWMVIFILLQDRC